MSEEVKQPENNVTDQPAAVADAATAVQDAPPVVAQDWPNDFRERFAGEDKDKLAYAARYNSVNDLLNAGYEAAKLIKKGEHKKFEKPGKDAAPEVLAEYRKNMGVPDSPDKYSLPEGVVLGEQDKPVFDAYFKAMHENNVPDDVAKTTVDWYYKMVQEREAQEAQQATEFKSQTEEALRSEWGAEYKMNYNMVESFAVNRFGEVVGRAILDAGPDAVKALAGIAREINPAATLMPNVANPTAAIDDEYKSLIAESVRMGTKFPKEKSDRLHKLAEARNRYQ